MFSVVKWLEVYLELDRSFASFDKLGSGACFSDVPIITGPRTLFFGLHSRLSFSGFGSYPIVPSVCKTGLSRD